MSDEFHTKTIEEKDVLMLTRKVYEADIPTGIGYDNFDTYQMRRSLVDDSGLLLKLPEGSILAGFEILQRYSREDEWKIIQWLSTQLFLNLGVRAPSYIWRLGDVEVDEDKRKPPDPDSGLGSLFG